MKFIRHKDAAGRLPEKENRKGSLRGILGLTLLLTLGVVLAAGGSGMRASAMRDIDSSEIKEDDSLVTGQGTGTQNTPSAGSPLTAVYRDSTVYVEASYGEEAKLPGDAELRASLVMPEDDPDAYSQKMAAAMDAMDQDDKTVPANAIYHVGFYVGDQEVEPAAPVNVAVQILQDGFSAGESIKVIHLGENDAEVIADTSADDAGLISFTTDEFSNFVFIGGSGGTSNTSSTSNTSGTSNTPRMEGNGIVGSGLSLAGRIRQIAGSIMPKRGSGTSGNEKFMTMANGSGSGGSTDESESGESTDESESGESTDESESGTPSKAINLNELTNEEVDLTFQYKDENDTWQNIPEGKNIFDYYNSDININFKFNKKFTQAELKEAGGTLTYDLPPYLKDFAAGQSGVLLDQNKEVAGTVTVENGKVTIQLTNDFISDNTTAEDLHFSLSGKVDLEKATDKEEGDKKYPGFNLEIPEDKKDLYSQYGTLELQKTCKSTAPQRDEKTGEWYVDYELTVTAPDLDMPEVKVEDIFNLTSGNANVQARLNGLIDAYVKYSVNNETLMSHDVGSTVPTDPKPANSVYQTEDENGVPQLNWYLGDMTKGETRTLHYRVRLNEHKMETTNFTTDGTILPNSANASSQTYPKDNTDSDLSIKTHVNVSKVAQENPNQKGHEPKVYFVPDGNGGGYIEYKVTVKNDKDYPVNVKVYDSVNDPNANTTNNSKADKGKGLSYDRNSFSFKDSAGNLLTPQPKVDFSVKGKDGAKYTSFTAHIGWLQPQQEVTFTYRINIDAETLATGTLNEKGEMVGAVDVNNGVLALFEGQTTTDDTYLTWLERYQQNHTVEQESWAAKNYGGAVEPQAITFGKDDTVYDATGESVTKMENPPESFELGENSFKYTVTVNGNTVWDVSSATMGDSLTNGLHYSGYVQVVAKDAKGNVLKTSWVNVNDLKEFSFKGDDIGFEGEGFGTGTSYELTYYTTVDEDNNNVHIVLGNDFSLTGDIIGPDGRKIINVSVQDSTSNMGETSNHLRVTKDAWYYEPDTATNLGAFYWVVKVDASYIPNGFALKDVAGEKHELRNDSLLGVYTGPEHTFGSESDWDAFQSSAATNGFEIFNQYSSKHEEGKGLMVTFDDGDITPAEDQYVYLFFKTYVTDRQADPYENKVYSNGDNIPGTTVDYFEDDAANYLPGVGGVEKAGKQVFDWDGSSTITMLGGTTDATYNLNANILNGGSVPAGRYAAWSVAVNKTGTMQGDFTITDQIPPGMELSFVAIAYVKNIGNGVMQNCTPPWPILLSNKDAGTPGLMVGGAFNNSTNYTNPTNRSKWKNSEGWKPWDKTNWMYYPGENNTVSWGLHIEDGECNDQYGNPHPGDSAYAFEVDYLVVCRVTDPDVLLGVTGDNPQKTFNNHVTVYGSDGKPVANADAQLTVPCKPVVTKEGIQDIKDSHLQQTIKFTLKVNEEATTVEGEENLILKDEMSENLILVKDSVKFYSDPDYTEELEDDVSFTSVGNVITFTIPNGKAVYIQYECLINAPAGVAEGTEGTPVENTVYFDGRKPDDQGETWKKTVHYDAEGGISGSKTMQITKKDSLTGDYLSGAEFEVTLLGVTDGNGVFVPSVGELEKNTLMTDADGISNDFPPREGGLYEIKETKAPAGYVPDNTPRYYWVGKGTFAPPSAEAADLPSGTKINAMYTGVIDVEITNERAKITVTKKFVNADGGEIPKGIEGTYTFGLFTKEGDTYVEAEAIYGARKQTLTYPGDENKVLTFYVPYSKNPTVEYYILELDKSGKPMEPDSEYWVQTETEGTMQFKPSYEYDNTDPDKASSEEGNTATKAENSGEGDTANAASSEDPKTAVTVTNTCYGAYSLPETGGPGTLVYLVTGLALVLGSGLVLTARKRRRQAQ